MQTKGSQMAFILKCFEGLPDLKNKKTISLETHVLFDIHRYTYLINFQML